MQAQPFGCIKCKYIYKTRSDVDNMQTQPSSTKTKNKFQDRSLAKLQSTEKWGRPGNIELRLLGFLRALPFPQLGSLLPFPFTPTMLIIHTEDM